MARDSRRRRNDRLIRALMGLGIVGLLIHAAWIAGFANGALDRAIDEWIYNAVLVVAAAVCLVRATEPTRERWTWLAFGLGLSFWTAGDIYWTAALSEVKNPPYPSLADALYLAVYPCMYVGVVLLIRQRVRFSAASWLDGAIGGLAAASLAVAILAPALVGLTKGDPEVVATNLAYPLGDVLLLAFLLGGFSVTGVRAGRTCLLIAAGIATWGIADLIYLYQQAAGTYDGGYLDDLWLIGGLAIAGGAATSSPSPRERVESRSMLYPAVFGAIAVGVLAWDHYEVQGDVSVWLAVATLAVVFCRMMLTFRENRVLLGAVRHDAVTDALTGLANRRRLMLELERAADGSREVIFASFDLDGFKAYNDTFGHPAGDMLLRRLGRSLDRAIEPHGRAFRLGGDEFCVLVDGGRDLAEGVLALATEALSEHGEGFDITASGGAVLMPEEAEGPTEALRIADTRMYADKGLRSSSAQRQTHDVLVRVLREREPELGEHLRGVARLAAEIAHAAGLEAEQIDSIVRAAELHDIGKIAIPDRILHKPGPLDDEEWELMRTHTTVGERILSAAPAMEPVALLVRSSHERWDGDGYPDQLEGDDVPLGARIIFVCDAFEAMTEERSYRDPVSPDEALEELRRCAGTQFDPRIVSLFARDVFPRLYGPQARASAARAGDRADLVEARPL